MISLHISSFRIIIFNTIQQFS